MKAKNKIMHYLYLKNNPTALLFENNQILYMRFQCIDMYGCPKLLDMNAMLVCHENECLQYHHQIALRFSFALVAEA